MELKQIYRKIRPYFPPIILNKVSNFIHFIDFLNYKKIISKNIKYKNKYLGKRCFILGSGPSIGKQNINYLKNENLFIMNNFCEYRGFGKISLGKGERFYVTSPNHPPHTEKEMSEETKRWDDMTSKDTIFFLGLNRYKVIDSKSIVDKYNLFKGKRVNYFYAGYTSNDFSTLSEKEMEIDGMIVGSGTCLVYTLIIAIYMGFKEIYLLGCDHDYVCNKNVSEGHCFKNESHIREVGRSAYGTEGVLKQKMFSGMAQIFKIYNEIRRMRPKIKIVNLSPTSLISTFEKEDYLGVLKRLNLKRDYGKNK
jgi:hypothetical protein